MINPYGGGTPPDIAALIAQELSALAQDAQTLATRLAPGDVVSAMVLPSNGLTDLLDVGGLRVAAELPPTLLPGEHIDVLVTGFDGDRINLQIVTATNPAAPPAIRTRSAVPSSTGGPAAPAALRPAAPNVAGTPVSALMGGRPAGGRGAAPQSGLGTSAARASVAGRAALFPTGSAADEPLSARAQTIEARLAAAHAAQPPTSAQAAGLRIAPGSANSSPEPGSAGLAQRGGVQTAPLSAARSIPAPPSAARPPISARPAATTGRTPIADQTAGPHRNAAAEPMPRGIAAFRQPAALLRGLGLALTTENLAIARGALDAPETLPATLAALDRELSAADDPDSATLRTLTTFVARLDPRSPVFGTQIAAFVDHIVTGREAKLGALFASVDANADRIDSARSDATADAGRPAAQLGRVAERAAVLRIGLDFDVKTQLLRIAAEHDGAAAPRPGEPLDRAVTGALSAITAVQLHAAAALSQNPDGLAFSVPVALPDGIAHAHVRIDRDAPGVTAAPLDGDNFHIAFVLDTRQLGTVAIEMLTVGRTVSLSVKTEAAVAARAFNAALKTLTGRLESLRYQVAKADAAVAPPAPAATTKSNRPQPSADPARLVDIDA